jgi:hypothetical protein
MLQTLRYAAGKEEPPSEIGAFLEKIKPLELQEIRIRARADPLAIGLTTARLIKIQTLLKMKGIAKPIKALPTLLPDYPAQVDEIDVIATVVVPPKR